MTSIDHLTCSARLRDYAGGALDPGAEREVESHLAACPQCREELRAVALLTATTSEPMSSGERRRLHSAVTGALREEPGRLGGTAAQTTRGRLGGTAAQTARGRAAAADWRVRLAPALAAAALLALVAVGGAYLLTSTSLSGSSGAGAGLEEGGAGGGGAQFDLARPEAAPETTTRALAGAAFDSSAGHLSEARLGQIGRTRVARQRALFTVPPAEIDAAAARLTNRLSQAAPQQLGKQVRTCVRTVRAETPDAVPVYAARGRVGDRVALVVGFVEQRAEGTPAYRVYAWPAGSCATPLSQSTGALGR